MLKRRQRGIAIPTSQPRPVHETPGEQIERLRASWSVVEGDDNRPLVIPTVTFAFSEGGVNDLSILDIMGSRPCTELYTMSGLTQQIGYASLLRSSLLFIDVKSISLDFSGSDIGTTVSQPERIKVLSAGYMALHDGDIIKIVDPSIPAEEPSGEAALLISLATANQAEFADLGFIQMMRTYVPAVAR
jgi:hypothetical protein